MRSMVAKMAIGVAITAIGMFGADSSAGTWKFNAAKSKTTAANPIKSQTDVREATPDGGGKVTRTGEMADGRDGGRYGCQFQLHLPIRWQGIPGHGRTV